MMTYIAFLARSFCFSKPVSAWYNWSDMKSIVILFKPQQRRGLRLRKPPSALFLSIGIFNA